MKTKCLPLVTALVCSTIIATLLAAPAVGFVYGYRNAKDGTGQSSRGVRVFIGLVHMILVPLSG